MEDQLKELAERTDTLFLGYRAESGYWKFQAGTDKLGSLLEALYRENSFWCDFLQSITAEHLPGNPAKIQLHYHLESLTRGLKVQVTCLQELLGESEIPVFPSMQLLWKAADWHEREAAELFGLKFEGHPDLRKLLLPADWQGFPLRKDYLAAESYHGLKIKYSKEG
jgi:NADH-quinone oxidoreductase subunit C